MRHFLRTFQDSLSSKKFYASLPEKSFSSSVGYYFTLIFVVAIIFAAVISWNVLPVVNSFAENIGPTIIQYYPENLEVSIKDGVASHNQEDPVFIPFAVPTEQGFELPKEGEAPFRYVLVIDTNTPFILEKFEEYETLSYLGPDSFVVINDNGNPEVFALKDLPEDFTVNQQSILSLIGKFQPLTRLLPALLFVLMFIVGFFFYSLSFVRIILAAIIILAIHRLRGLNYSFKKSYQVALHASTLSIVLIPGILLFLHFDIPVPFLFTALTVIVATLFMPQPSKAMSVAESQ